MTNHDLLSTNLDVTGVATGLGEVLFFVLVVGVMVVALAFGVVKLLRLFKYRIDVEFYERKGSVCSYHSDDKARMATSEEGSSIIFLKNRTLVFKGHNFPDSDVLVKKRGGGTKLKMLIDGDQLTPLSPDFVLSSAGLRQLDSIPTYQKTDYLQRAKRYTEKYKNKDNYTRNLVIAGFAGAGIVLLFGFFVIWQSNVATADALHAAVDRFAGLLQDAGNTIPPGPG